LNLRSAKGHELDPYGYLKFVIEQLPLAETPDQLNALCPWNLKNDELIAWDKA